MKLNGSQIVLEVLKEQGVDTIFGYPGGTILNIFDELYKYGDTFKHILTAHEQGASHAADGYARATGKVGVCFATSGPGATNLVTGIATAYMDSVPVVAITCNYATSGLGRDSFQEVDICGITMPITKHNFQIKSVEELADTIRRAFSIAQSGRKGPVLIDIPKDKKNGDYSTNVAFLLTKELKKSPILIAEDIANNIKDEMIEKVEIANPGFINIFLSKKFLLDNINKILEEGKDYGRNNSGNNEKINIEYVSANPTGTLHIGHGRGAVYGDNLSKLMSFCGYDVTREYYINDAGNQMYNLGVSIKERYKERCGLEWELPENGYHGKEIIQLAESLYDTYGDSKLDEDIPFFKEAGLDILLEGIKKDLDKFRVNFDVFTSEQSLYDKGLVENTLNKLKDSGKCYISEDALWLRTTDLYDEKDRVLIKSDGNYTYLLPDIAYHSDKLNRGFDRLIDVLGSDHHGYINRLRSSLEMVGYDSSKLEIKILQMVRLLRNGEEVKLSKRTGKTITLNELIEDVGVNAARYFFASKSLDTQMDFDLDLAVKNSNENPIYYIEYANARISSILKNKEVEKIDNYSTMNNETAYTVLNKLMEFEDILINAASRELPHMVANYLYELASLFHSYYSKEKIVTEDIEYTKERLAFIKAIKIVMNNAANILGLILREEM